MPKVVSKSVSKKTIAPSTTATPYAKTKPAKKGSGKAVVIKEKVTYSHSDKYKRMYFELTEQQYDRLHAEAQAMNLEVQSLPIFVDKVSDLFLLRAKFQERGNKQMKQQPDMVEGHEYRIDALMYTSFMSPMDEEGERNADGKLAITYIKMKNMEDLSPPDLETVPENEDEEEEEGEN
jgi:hypothetical protein